jgi:hypothetical protein
MCKAGDTNYTRYCDEQLFPFLEEMKAIAELHELLQEGERVPSGPGLSLKGRRIFALGVPALLYQESLSNLVHLGDAPATR